MGPELRFHATTHIDAQIDALEMVRVVGRDDDRGVFAEVALPVGAGLPDNPLAGAVGDEVRERGRDIAGKGLHGGDGQRDAVGKDVKRDKGRLAVVREIVGDDHVLTCVLRERDV